MQQQLAVAGNQTKDLFAMQAEAARQTYELLNAGSEVFFGDLEDASYL